MEHSEKDSARGAGAKATEEALHTNHEAETLRDVMRRLLPRVAGPKKNQIDEVGRCKLTSA